MLFQNRFLRSAMQTQLRSIRQFYFTALCHVTARVRHKNLSMLKMLIYAEAVNDRIGVVVITTMTTESRKNGATTTFRMNFSG